MAQKPRKRPSQVSATHTAKGKPRKLPLKTTKPAHSRAFDPATMCGAQLRRQQPGILCHNPKGFQTPHLGDGRCWLHGGLTPIKHGLTSLVKHGRLKDMLESMREVEHNLMDLTPEVEMIRALVLDYLNRYDDFVDQLETWYNALDADRADNGLPPVPRRIPDLESAGQLLEQTTRMVERMHKMKREGSITLDMFRGIMSQMGMTVAKHVNDPSTLDKIEAEWSQIMVDPRSFVRSGEDTAPDEETVE